MIEPAPVASHAAVIPADGAKYNWNVVLISDGSVTVMPRHATSGSWRPGKSANPGGRPVGPIRDIAALARTHGPAAIQTLIDCLRDPKHKVAAAIALLDRGFGKPAVTLASDPTRPLAIDFRWADASPLQQPTASIIDAEPVDKDMPLTRLVGEK